MEPSQNHSDSTWATHQKSTKQGNTKNSHIGCCTHTSESTNVKVQNIFHVWNNTACSTNCKYRTAATLHTLETWFISGIKAINIIIINTWHNLAFAVHLACFLLPWQGWGFQLWILIPFQTIIKDLYFINHTFLHIPVHQIDEQFSVCHKSCKQLY